MLPAVISIYTELDERACHELDEELSLRVVEDDDDCFASLSLRVVEDDDDCHASLAMTEEEEDSTLLSAEDEEVSPSPRELDIALSPREVEDDDDCFASLSLRVVEDDDDCHASLAMTEEDEEEDSSSRELDAEKSGCVEDVSSQAMKRAKKMETVMNVKILAISKKLFLFFF